MSYTELLLPEVLPAAPGCLDEVARRAIRAAAMEFFRDSTAWRHTTEGSAVIEGAREVELSLPRGTFIHRVFWARIGDRDLKGISERWASDDSRGIPREYSVPSGGRQLLLNPIPQKGEFVPGLIAHVALVPGFDSTDIPRNLLEKYRMGLVYGAIRNVLATPGAAWSDIRLAGEYGMMFETEKAHALRASNADNAPIVRKVRYGGL